MTHTKTQLKSDIFNSLDQLREKGQFGNELHPQIDVIVEKIAQLKRSKIFTNEDIKEITYYYGNAFLDNTLQGMGLLKKFGYAGDFLMIDRIYTKNTVENPFFNSWDNYFQNQAAPIAVRNRKEYFKNIILNSQSSSIKLLNIASGPARDLLELYESLPQSCELETTCIEMDKHAVEYAENLTAGFSDKIEFINRNIFRFQTDKKFDVIWSAGLFDYFDDKVFVSVLRRLRDWCNPNGTIVIGNFNENHNPTRNYMEIFGEWFLNHRTEGQLIDLAKEAGYGDCNLRVEREPENVNLFLHIELK